MDDCQLKTEKLERGKLMFYVNGKLKHIIDDFDEIIARDLTIII
jgi:hypothetical protein